MAKKMKNKILVTVEIPVEYLSYGKKEYDTLAEKDIVKSLTNDIQHNCHPVTTAAWYEKFKELQETMHYDVWKIMSIHNDTDVTIRKVKVKSVKKVKN